MKTLSLDQSGCAAVSHRTNSGRFSRKGCGEPTDSLEELEAEVLEAVPGRKDSSKEALHPH